MKRFPVIFALVVLALVLTSCGASDAPVAYTRFEPSGDQYIYFSTNPYGSQNGQMSVYTSKEACMNEETPLIEFHFGYCLGSDLNPDDGFRYTLVDLSEKRVWMAVYVNKSVYNQDYRIYLNDVALNGVVTDEDEFYVLHYYSVNLTRTNPYSKIDYSRVNKLEYK